MEGVLSEILYGDDLVMMNETIDGRRNIFMKWEEAFKSNFKS